MRELLRVRLPGFAEMWQIFGLVDFIVFGWSVGGFLYQLPSVRFFMSFGDIVAILSYRLAVALLESLAVVGALLVLSAVLPPAALKRGFVYKACLVVLTAVVASQLFERYYTIGALLYPDPAPFRLAIIFSGLCCLMLAVLLSLMHINPRWRRPVLSIVDRTSVFAYIYLPLGLVGLLVVMVRILR